MISNLNAHLQMVLDLDWWQNSTKSSFSKEHYHPEGYNPLGIKNSEKLHHQKSSILKQMIKSNISDWLRIWNKYSKCVHNVVLGQQL